MPRTRLAAAAAALLILAGCGRDGTGPTSRLSAAEARALALQMAASGDAYAGAVAAPDVVALSTTGGTAFGPITFTRAHPCPKGGSVLPDVTIQGSLDVAARSLTLDVRGTETPQSCAYTVDENTITVSGNPDLAITAHLSIVAGEPSGVQTFTEKGGFTWRSSDGRGGACTVDLTSTADFGANRRTLAGTFCGNTLELSGPLR